MEEKNNTNNNFGQENGYTVNPDSNSYRATKEEIIQDSNPLNEPVKPQIITPVKAQKEYKGSKQKRGMHGLWVILIACGLSLVIGALSGFLAAGTVSEIHKKLPIGSEAENHSDAPINNVNINIDETAENIVEAVATKVTPSVVGIRTTTSVNSFFYGTQESSGEGSGVIYTADGYIITNYHVIADGVSNKSGSKIEVFIDSNAKKAYNATVVGYNIAADLAVIKINATGLTPIEFTDSDTLKVGQYVITVGNPGGLEFMDSVTYGVVSGLDRVVATNGDIKLIQTDAAINPGNSGGALVNTRGELVGINSVLSSPTGSYAGYGFAIPTSIMTKVITDLKEYGTVQRALLGISGKDLNIHFDDEMKKKAEELGVSEGVWVKEVVEGSAASAAGIQADDVIIGIDNKKIKTMAELQEELAKHRPGDKVKVKLIRDKKEKTVTVELKNAQGNTKVVKNVDMDLLGAAFKELPDELKRQLNLGYGLQVTGVTDGKMKDAGIRKGVILLKANNQPLRKVADLEDVLKAASQSPEQVLFITGIMPSGKRVNFAVDLSQED